MNAYLLEPKSLRMRLYPSGPFPLQFKCNVPPTHVFGNEWSLVDGDLAPSSVVLVEI